MTSRQPTRTRRFLRLAQLTVFSSLACGSLFLLAWCGTCWWGVQVDCCGCSIRLEEGDILLALSKPEWRLLPRDNGHMIAEYESPIAALYLWQTTSAISFGSAPYVWMGLFGEQYMLSVPTLWVALLFASCGAFAQCVLRSLPGRRAESTS